MLPQKRPNKVISSGLHVTLKIQRQLHPQHNQNENYFRITKPITQFHQLFELSWKTNPKEKEEEKEKKQLKNRSFLSDMIERGAGSELWVNLGACNNRKHHRRSVQK